jgi:hypothetical protein
MLNDFLEQLGCARHALVTGLAEVRVEDQHSIIRR